MFDVIQQKRPDFCPPCNYTSFVQVRHTSTTTTSIATTGTDFDHTIHEPFQLRITFPSSFVAQGVLKLQSLQLHKTDSQGVGQTQQDGGQQRGAEKTDFLLVLIWRVKICGSNTMIII